MLNKDDYVIYRRLNRRQFFWDLVYNWCIASPRSN